MKIEVSKFTNGWIEYIKDSAEPTNGRVDIVSNSSPDPIMYNVQADSVTWNNVAKWRKAEGNRVG